MTKEEGLEKLFRYCNEEVKRSGWWIFNKKKITFKPTRILEDYEKTANIPIPEKLIAGIAIDKNGVYGRKNFYSWKNICASAIKVELRHTNDESRAVVHDYYLLLFLDGGDIIELLLKDVEPFYGQIGHFIELYKIEYANTQSDKN